MSLLAEYNSAASDGLDHITQVADHGLVVFEYVAAGASIHHRVNQTALVVHGDYQNSEAGILVKEFWDRMQNSDKGCGYLERWVH